MNGLLSYPGMQKRYKNTFPGAKHTHAYTHIHISQQLTYVQAHTYKHMHMKIHACLVYTSTHMWICRYGRIQIQTRTHFYVHSHICTHAYPHIHAHKDQDLQTIPVTALLREADNNRENVLCLIMRRTFWNSTWRAYPLTAKSFRNYFLIWNPHQTANTLFWL